MNPLIFDSNVLHGYFEEANADSYIVAAHVKPPEIGSIPRMKVNDNTAVSPQWFCNVLKSRRKNEGMVEGRPGPSTRSYHALYM